MTEDEAKTKWCPFVLSDNSDNAINRWCDGAFQLKDGSYKDAFKCIGSECMAWRTTFIEREDPSGEVVRHNGYCGLAGTP